MPLDKSGSKLSIGKNIKTEMSVGKPQKQAVAIALNTQRDAKKPKMKVNKPAPMLGVYKKKI